jgi:hypothetical protein
MRTFLLVSVGSVLLAVAACGDSSSESNGEITSQEDVQQLFQTIMPDLITALTDLADELSLAISSSTTEKGGSGSSTISCPGGGSLGVDLNTGQATLTNCSAGGVTISASLLLSVFNTGGFYTANFSGTLMVSGSFTGSVQVTDALVQWTVPANPAAVYWDATVLINGLSYTATSGRGDVGPCPVVDVTPGSVEFQGACDDNGDCSQGFPCIDCICI